MVESVLINLLLVLAILMTNPIQAKIVEDQRIPGSTCTMMIPSVPNPIFIVHKLLENIILLYYHRM
jgi:hypothetical protein